jgi:hypothetical protein
MTDNLKDNLAKLLDQLIDDNLKAALARDLQLFDSDEYHTGSPALYNAVSQFLKNQGVQVDVENDEGASGIKAAAEAVRARRASIAAVASIPKIDPHKE